MKPHLIMTVDPRAAGSADVTAFTEGPIHSWLSFLRDRSRRYGRFLPGVDNLFARYRLPVWITAEYPPAGNRWTPEERLSGLNRVFRFILQENRDIPPDLIRDLRLLPSVQSVRPGRVVTASRPMSVEEGARPAAYDESRDAIGLPEAHQWTHGNRKVRVAVLDTGVSTRHPELAGQLEDGFDFVDILSGAAGFIGDTTEADPDPEDEVGHGTHVAGIIAARGKRMPLGAAPSCRVIPVRALAAMRKDGRRIGAGLIDNINVAMKWAVDQGADVINMSLGVRHEGGGLPHAEVVDYARRKGVTIVAASGNDGRREMYYPSALPYVIAVGASGPDGQVAPFSTFNEQVALIAPGTDIFSSYLGDRYAVASGTSQAAPFVAAAAALLKSFALERGTSLSDRQIKSVLAQTADRIDRRWKHPKAGFGIINIADALRWLDHRFSSQTSRRPRPFSAQVWTEMAQTA